MKQTSKYVYISSSFSAAAQGLNFDLSVCLRGLLTWQQPGSLDLKPLILGGVQVWIQNYYGSLAFPM